MVFTYLFLPQLFVFGYSCNDYQVEENQKYPWNLVTRIENKKCGVAKITLAYENYPLHWYPNENWHFNGCVHIQFYEMIFKQMLTVEDCPTDVDGTVLR